MHGAYRSTLPGCIKQRISISAFIIMSVFVIFGLWQWEKEVSLSLSTGTVQPGFLVWWVGSDDAATPT
jgi:small neutral amino acid transporter SnatA (MarC family)